MKLVRKGPAGTAINTEGWMMSYADMATTLLAMFIVLSTLGKDQTGVNLYKGTGSFVRALESFGLPGWFSNSSQAVQMDASSPHYLDDDTETPPEPNATGMEAGTGKGEDRVIDGEEEKLQHFLHEMERHLPVARLPRTKGQAIVDCYERLNASSPYLAPRPAELLWQVMPLLRRPTYRVVLVVWATTPSESAWLRAARQAQQVVEDVGSAAHLDASARARFLAVGQPWRYPDQQRPVLSLIIERTEKGK